MNKAVGKSTISGCGEIIMYTKDITSVSIYFIKNKILSFP